MVRVLMMVAMTTATLAAQWLKEPTRGIPRTADGKPNLTAPAPKTADGKPDLSGLWRMDPNAYAGNVSVDLKPDEIKPWAQELYKQRFEDLGKDNPAVYQCTPAGPLYSIGFGMAKFIQTPSLTAILYEDLSYRQIFTDGRPLPKDPNPSWMGYSIGHWEGDTLVVESSGFNDRSWLDGGGHPHTEALRLTERFRRRDFGHMEIQLTLEDREIYAKPWTIKLGAEFIPDTEMLEYVCNENEKDHVHLVGKNSDDKKNAVKVPVSILSTYVGTYEFTAPEDPNQKFPLNVTLAGEVLMMDFGGKDPMPMIPLSETEFSATGGRAKFVKNDKGEVTDMIFSAVEGDLKGPRKKL